MNTSPQVSEWWEALRSDFGRSGETVGLLFRYDPQNQALYPCFPKSAGFDDIPSRAVEDLYEAACGRRLVALRPEDLAPCLVAADSSASLCEPPSEVRQQARRLAGGMLEQIRQYLHQSRIEQGAGQQRLRSALRGGGDDSRTNELLRSVYAAHQAAALANAVLRMPIVQSLRGEADDLMWRAAVLSAQTEAVLSQCLRDEEEEKERQRTRERSRQYMTAEILAQQRARGAERDAPRSAQTVDVFSSLREALADAEPPEEAEPTAQEKSRANDVLHRLHRSALKGGKAAVRRLIDSVVSGCEPPSAPSAYVPAASDALHSADTAAPESSADILPDEPQESGISAGRGVILGNALRQFAQYAAGEVPLSVKHAETGRLCRTFLAMAREEGFSPADMGLSPTEYTAVLGTIQLGLVVKHGLEASDTLLSADRSSPEKFFLALRDYLSMKAVDQALLPHAAAHQEAIAAGETPISPIQILMGNPGFSAKDIHRAVAGSSTMAELFSASPDRLAFLLRSRADMSELACRTMAACYGAEPSGPRAQERSHTSARTHTNWGPAR